MILPYAAAASVAAEITKVFLRRRSRRLAAKSAA